MPKERSLLDGLGLHVLNENRLAQNGFALFQGRITSR